MFQSYVRIQVPESKYTSRIILENFSRFLKNKEYTCCEFYSSSERWHFGLYKSNLSLSVKLYRLSSNVDTSVKCKICFSDSNGKVIHDQSEERLFEGSRDKNVGHELVVINETTLNKLANPPNDTLIITADLSFYKMFIKEVETMQSLRDYTLGAQDILSMEILEMYDNNVHTDVVLSIQGERINAHKIILCARSPVFAKMFQQDMAESVENVVEIKDIKLAAMKELVDFMYTRVRVNYDFDTAMDVYYAADKYEVQRLRKTCRMIIVRHLNVNNALRALKMADRHEDGFLKSEVINFINNKFKDCVNTDWWADFAKEQSDLYKELMRGF